MNKKWLVYLVLAVVVLLGVYFIFSSQSPNQPGAGNPTQPPKTISGQPVTTKIAAVQNIKIQNYKFSPDTDVVSLGTKITWTNYDSVAHTVTSNDGYFASKNLTTGAAFSYTFNKKGTFYYHCSIHPDMLGRIIIQ